MKSTLDQERAKHALRNLKSSYKKDEISEIRGVPTMILTSGLGQTLAFYHAKQDVHSVAHTMLKDATEWLKEKKISKQQNSGDLSHFIKEIVDNDSVFLRRVTEEVLAYIQWYIRLAEGRKAEG